MKLIALTNPDIHGEEQRLYSQDKVIIQTLKNAGHEVHHYFYDRKVLDILGKSFIFNLCDSFPDGREEYAYVGLLEQKGFSFTGCPAETVYLCQSKFRQKAVFEDNGIAHPHYQLFTSSEQEFTLQFPVILKPTQSNASIGIDDDSVVFNEKELRTKLVAVMEEFKEVMAEEYIDGREFCVPMMGNENPEVLNILEINYADEYFLDKPKVLSYKAKWSRNSNAFKHTYSMLAEGLNESDRKKVIDLALSAYKAMGCQGYATADIRMNSLGEPFILEVNPNAYIAQESDLAKAAASKGMNYEALLGKILELAKERCGWKEEAETAQPVEVKV